jgi:hypothetical protein
MSGSGPPFDGSLPSASDRFIALLFLERHAAVLAV